MTPAAFVAIGASGASAGFLAYSVIRYCVVRPRRRKHEWREAKERGRSVKRHPLADSSWPDAPTVHQERLREPLEVVREIGELEDLYALPAYRGRER
jgi:hypothetical protein